MYYCVLCLDLPQPKLKSMSVSMFVTIAEHNPAPILALIPRLVALTNDSWWEVQAQLGRLCGALLDPSKATQVDEEEKASGGRMTPGAEGLFGAALEKWSEEKVVKPEPAEVEAKKAAPKAAKKPMPMPFSNDLVFDLA